MSVPQKQTIAVDIARLPVMLTELRLPTIARLWPRIAETADAESWPVHHAIIVEMNVESY